jgi:hypothetical protein
LNFQKMQVAKQPFLVSTLDLNGKKVLVRLEVADKDKGKGGLIGDPRVPDESKETFSKKVIVENTLDGGEMLKITIRPSNTGGQAHKRGETKTPIMCIMDDPTHRRGRSGLSRWRTWHRLVVATATNLQTSSTRNRYTEAKHS